jgi:hypothetical protein
MYGDSIDFGKFLLYKLIKKRPENQAAPCAHANLSPGKKVLDKAKKFGYIGAAFRSRENPQTRSRQGFHVY